MMAFTCRLALFLKYPHLLRSKSLKMNPNLTGSHFLFTPAFLRMDKFQLRREKAQNLFKNKDDTFKKTIEYSAKEVKDYDVYEHDLRNMIYLCKNDNNELELLKRMAKRYSSQHLDKSEHFNFGPELMRLYYLFNIPHEAKEAMYDAEMKSFFNDSASNLILMTLLYNSGLYQDVVDEFYRLSEGFFHNSFPRTFTTLVMAAYYQMNSSKSLEAALSLLNRLEQPPNKPRSLDPRQLSFVAALALEQGNPHLAFEVASKDSRLNFVLKNIKAKALVQLGRPEDAISILRSSAEASSLKKTSEENEGLFIFDHTLNEVEVVLKQEGKSEALSELTSVKWNLAKESLIVQKPLKELLCEPINTIESTSLSKRQRERQKLAAALKKGFKR